MQIRPKIETRLPIASRALNADNAASYLGMGVTKFRELVEEGKLPRPVYVDSMPRWDRTELDAAFEAMKEQTVDPRSEGRARLQAKIDAQRKAGEAKANERIKRFAQRTREEAERTGVIPGTKIRLADVLHHDWRRGK